MNFEFNFDPEEERRKKKFPQQFTNINLLLDDNAITIKNLDKGNKTYKNSIDNLNDWTIKHM